MAKDKSLVRFIREQLKFKGSTEHSGRGFWMCYVDATWAEFSARVHVVADKLHEKGIVTAIAYKDDEICVTFKVKAEPMLAHLYPNKVSTVCFNKQGIEGAGGGMYAVGAGWNIDV
jgi:hypothetical protein